MAGVDSVALAHLDAVRFRDIVDPAVTALLVIDIQVDFVSPDGRAAQLGADVSDAGRAIDAIETLIAKARELDMTVVFMRVVTRPDTDHRPMLRLKQRRVPPSDTILCRAGSGGEDYYRLSPRPGDVEVEKPLFDSFHETDLDAELRTRGIETLLVTGVATDCCVDSTVRRAFHLGYDVVVVSDACAGASQALHWGALQGLERNVALLVDTETALEGLTKLI